jgi:hypothetical protein
MSMTTGERDDAHGSMPRRPCGHKNGKHHLAPRSEARVTATTERLVTGKGLQRISKFHMC